MSCARVCRCWIIFFCYRFFFHFTYHFTEGSLLSSDLKGVNCMVRQIIRFPYWEARRGQMFRQVGLTKVHVQKSRNHLLMFTTLSIKVDLNLNLNIYHCLLNLHIFLLIHKVQKTSLIQRHHPVKKLILTKPNPCSSLRPLANKTGVPKISLYTVH